MAIRILVADDHGVLRAGLRALLDAEPDMTVVSEASDGATALRLAISRRPNVVLLDISLPDDTGIEVTRRLRAACSDTQVLILTVHEDVTLLREAIRAGAAGYIVKRAIESELINAIRAVHRGDHYVHPSMTHALLQGEPPSTPIKEGLVEELTPREIDVLRLIAQGYTNRQAAEILTISVRTVETHRANIMDKLDAQGRVDLVRYAQKYDLLE